MHAYKATRNAYLYIHGYHGLDSINTELKPSRFYAMKSDMNFACTIKLDDVECWPSVTAFPVPG